MNITPAGAFSRLGDTLMVPIMYLVSGTFWEEPQKTHYWNNEKKIIPLKQDGESKMVSCIGITGEKPAFYYGIPFCHLPILGGWRNYIVLEPVVPHTWFVGWQAGNLIGISRIPLQGRVRMLIGPDTTTFVGFAKCGTQIDICRIGEGRIGEGGPFARDCLL